MPQLSAMGIDWSKKMKVYEIRRDDFEFYKDNKPTGKYVRGIAINGTSDKLRLELLCNGMKVWLPKCDLIMISEDNQTLGRGYYEPFIRKGV